MVVLDSNPGEYNRYYCIIERSYCSRRVVKHCIRLICLWPLPYWTTYCNLKSILLWLIELLSYLLPTQSVIPTQKRKRLGVVNGAFCFRLSNGSFSASSFAPTEQGATRSKYFNYIIPRVVLDGRSRGWTPIYELVSQKLDVRLESKAWYVSSAGVEPSWWLQRVNKTRKLF